MAREKKSRRTKSGKGSARRKSGLAAFWSQYRIVIIVFGAALATAAVIIRFVIR